ncbi:uncharacterized protein LOC113403346 [Vanessa tameamea]|uniref:Uncharacterized protein LOC113403346 n=1 Tax=Vanessa tameamea TaxID=334116 RepID=A0A8B8ISZ3_VANTA|nr:uncharacterized protein LOC113403346 [Vanessa tameamea]XP_026499647.1 uncharacterized protein LOC113403346 [Vanessa tameamea]
MGGCRCTYRNCTVKTDGKTHMFHYPVFEKVRCHQWLVNAQRLEFLDLKVSQLKNRVVCQHHFKEENFMNYKKDKLTFDAIPTENGPFCDPSKFVDSSQEMTKSYPNLILLEDIENEVIFNDKKANFSLKYGDFLTNGEVMDSTSRYHSDNINLSKENTNIISKPKFYLKNEQEMNQQLFKPRFTTLTLPSKSVSKMQPQPMLIVPPYTDLSLDIEGGKEIIQEQGTINIYEPNPSSYKNNTRNANSLLHLNTTPSQHNNEVLVKKEPKVKILSEKKIEIRGPIPVMGKLEKVPHSITINIPNRKKEENISDKKGINNPLVKIPSDKLKILEVLDVEFNGVPKTDVATEVPKPKTIETDINYVPASQPLPKTPQIKNKITSERSAAIEKKRKFNMRMKDILETCLDKLDDSIKVNDKNPPPVKASSKSLIKQPQPKVTDQQVGTHLAKEQTLPNAQEYTIAYLDARMKSMERALLNKIEQNSQRILELKDSFGNIKTCKEPNDKKNVSVQTSINEDCYKKFLYQEMSQYLSPDSNSLIYEELFINKYSVVDTSPQRKRRRKYI